jgi:hypothetical protein
MIRGETITTSVERILESFELLPEAEKYELVRAIILRSQTLDLPGLTDAELVSAADELFLSLDASEGGNG